MAKPQLVVKYDISHMCWKTKKATAAASCIIGSSLGAIEDAVVIVNPETKRAESILLTLKEGTTVERAIEDADEVLCCVQMRSSGRLQ